MSEVKELKRFIYSAMVTNSSGSQSFYIDAKSREEADERAAKNESDGMYTNDSEVTDLDSLEYEDETTVDDFGDLPLISREQSLLAKLEAAELELIKPLPIGELLHRLEGQTYRKWYDDDELNKWRDRAEAAEARLLVPVKLPSLYNMKMAGDKSTRSMFSGNNSAIKDCAKAIRAAGYPVEGGE